ncbi:hypothetical protein Bca4012_051552 [Brassica carinata]|uniref:Uncharacterized protein n=2 Tax=Brassica TaxID=3705 RepID=A0A0D3AU13_BRAOL|nr:unnamed protein product [Brassica napus]
MGDRLMTGLKTLVQFLRSCDGGDGRSDAQGVKRSKLETQQNNHRKPNSKRCVLYNLILHGLNRKAQQTTRLQPTD